MKTTVGVNSFVKRQTKESGKTYSKKMTFKEIAEHAHTQIQKENYKKGYRDGVILVQVEKSLVNNFVCPIIKIDKNTKLVAEYTKRRDDEEPYIKISALNEYWIFVFKCLVLGEHFKRLYSTSLSSSS